MRISRLPIKRCEERRQRLGVACVAWAGEAAARVAMALAGTVQVDEL